MDFYAGPYMPRVYRLSEAGRRERSKRMKQLNNELNHERPLNGPLNLSPAQRRERSERFKRLNEDPDFAERRDAATQRRWEQTKVAHWLDRLEKSKGGHTPGDAERTIADLQREASRVSLIIPAERVEKAKEALVRPKNGGAAGREEEPTRPTPAQEPALIKPKLNA